MNIEMDTAAKQKADSTLTMAMENPRRTMEL